MKVLHVVNTYADASNPAAEPFVRAQIKSLESLGVEVRVFNVQGTVSKVNYFKAVGRVRDILNKERFDLIHGHYVYSGWVAALQSKVPALVSFMGSDLLGSRKVNGRLTLQGRFDAFLSWLLQFFVSGIIVKSNGMQDRLRDKRKSVILPNGVNFELFRVISRSEARKQLGLSDAKRYVLFAGNPASGNKGYFLVRQAVTLLQRRYEGLELLLAHGQPHDQMPIYMNAADVLVLASQYEGSPNVVKEALACNLAVVSTDVGDVRDFLNRTGGGILVNRDPEAIAFGIEQMVGQVRVDSRSRMEHLRIENVARSCFEFYEDVLARSG